MSRERWGTFSVVDHLRPQAFVADVLLYDRLVIPVPPEDDNERERWISIGRNPNKLDSDLEILGDKAIKVSWGEEQHEAFKSLYETAKMVNFDVKNLEQTRGVIDPLDITRMLLTTKFLPELPKGVAKVWAMAAYLSLNRYQQGVDEEKKADEINNEQRKQKLAMVLTHQFLVPDEDGKSDEYLLQQAVDLSGDSDFKKHRKKFYDWQDDIIENGITDEKAIEEMDEYLDDYNDVVKRAVNKVRWKFGFLVVNLALDFIGAAVINPLIVSKAALDVWSFAKFERKPDIDAGDCDAAAMIHDFRKEFKWKESHV